MNMKSNSSSAEARWIRQHKCESAKIAGGESGKSEPFHTEESATWTTNREKNWPQRSAKGAKYPSFLRTLRLFAAIHLYSILRFNQYINPKFD
jgi:hypothetical protein